MPGMTSLQVFLSVPYPEQNAVVRGATVVGAGRAAGQTLRDGYEGKNYYLQT